MTTILIWDNVVAWSTHTRANREISHGDPGKKKLRQKPPRRQWQVLTVIIAVMVKRHNHYGRGYLDIIAVYPGQTINGRPLRTRARVLASPSQNPASRLS